MPIVNRNRRRGWTQVLVFWILFAASIGLGRGYPWLDTIWYAAGVLVLLSLSIYSIVYRIRHSRETGTITYQGLPRWLVRFSMDEYAECRSDSVASSDSECPTRTSR